VTGVLLFFAVIFSYLSAFFAQTAGKLHTARWARLHEFMRLSVSKREALKNMPAIYIGFAPFNRLFVVRPTKTQKELASLILLGKTRVGKGLNITTNLLTWQFPVVVNDIKREFWDQTSGWREKGLNGRSFKFDPRGLGRAVQC
jgi:type IV secretory pathway TraG/TraD family ATPase VirD4